MTNVDHLRRLRVLQALAAVSPDPMGEVAILHAVRVDPELSPTVERVRKSLNYLGGIGFVELVTFPGSDWLAGCITSAGLEWLNATTNDEHYDIYNPAEKPAPASTATAGRVSSIKKLPAETKAWLDQELVRRSFTGYIELAELLASQGFEISKSAIGRYGKAFKEEQDGLRQSIEMAKAFAEVVGDDGAAMNQTLTALAQQELMAVVRERRYDEKIKLPDMVRAISQLNRSDINTRKFQIEQAAQQKALNAAADEVEKAAIAKGLDAEQAQFWREKVLGAKL